MHKLHSEQYPNTKRMKAYEAQEIRMIFLNNK